VPPEARYAKSGDVNIAYQVLGEGSVDLVLVPGFVSNVDSSRSGAQLRFGTSSVGSALRSRAGYTPVSAS